MLLKFKQSCTDKYSNRRYNVGDEVDFDDKRAKEILADKRDMAVAVETKKSPKPEPVKEPIEEPTEEPKPKAKRIKK